MWTAVLRRQHAERSLFLILLLFPLFSHCSVEKERICINECSLLLFGSVKDRRTASYFSTWLKEAQTSAGVGGQPSHSSPLRLLPTAITSPPIKWIADTGVHTRKTILVDGTFCSGALIHPDARKMLCCVKFFQKRYGMAFICDWFQVSPEILKGWYPATFRFLCALTHRTADSMST